MGDGDVDERKTERKRGYMKQEDFLKGEITAIRHCPTRGVCPFGDLCGVDGSGDARTIAPALIDVSKDDLIWSSLRNEQRVIAIKSGLFATVTVNNEVEEPFSIYGPGYCCGLSELYIDDAVSATYYLKALADSTVCSFPANAFRHRLESLPASESLRIVSSALTNWASASFELMKLCARGKKSERLALFLKYLFAQSSRAGAPLSSIRLSHDDVAFLLRSDRVSVTRALHCLEDAGLITLGYKTIALSDDFDDRVGAFGNVNLYYHGV